MAIFQKQNTLYKCKVRKGYFLKLQKVSKKVR